METVFIKKFLVSSIIFAVIAFLGINGCSLFRKHSQDLPEPLPTATPTPIPTPPEYTKVVHPARIEIDELSRIFLDVNAPKNSDFAQQCTSDFYQLASLIQTKEEQDQGVRELTHSNPTHYHWCFYARLLELENRLKKEAYIDEKQKLVLDEFSFLAPVAKAFLAEFHDSRYFRWLVFRYQKLSELLFYRKLELTPLGTSELVSASNPLESWSSRRAGQSILEKYHFVETSQIPEISSVPSPVPSPSPVALESVPNPDPTPTPTSIPTSIPTPIATP